MPSPRWSPADPATPSADVDSAQPMPCGRIDPRRHGLTRALGSLAHFGEDVLVHRDGQPTHLRYSIDPSRKCYAPSTAFLSASLAFVDNPGVVRSVETRKEWAATPARTRIASRRFVGALPKRPAAQALVIAEGLCRRWHLPLRDHARNPLGASSRRRCAAGGTSGLRREAQRVRATAAGGTAQSHPATPATPAPPVTPAPPAPPPRRSFTRRPQRRAAGGSVTPARTRIASRRFVGALPKTARRASPRHRGGVVPPVAPPAPRPRPQPARRLIAEAS
jgi:hypothetical protein